MSAESTVSQIINAALERATTMTEAAVGYAEDAITRSDSVVYGGPTASIDITRRVPDEITLVDGTAAITDGYDATTAELIGKLATIFGGFLTTYFPRSGTAVSAAETWLESAVSGSWTGIPSTVEAQIWDRSRARELEESARREDELAATFAARGFSIPSGAMLGAVQSVRQDVANKVATHGRDVAIKQAEIIIDTVKFAVGEALRERANAIQAAIEYWKSYLLPYETAARRASVEVSLANTFTAAAVNYFQAQVAFYGQNIEADKAMLGSNDRTYAAFLAWQAESTKSRVIAATSSSEMAGKIAAAAQGALNTLAQYGYSETHNTGVA